MNKVLSKSFALTVVVFILGTIVFFAPQASAATVKPTCLITVTHDGVTTLTKSKEEIVVLKNTSVTIAWNSNNATKAIDGNRNIVATSGTATVTPAVKTKYEYTFSQGSKKVTCSLEVNIISGTITTKMVAKNGEKINLTGKVLGAKKVTLVVTAVGTTTPTYTTKALSVKNKKYSFANAENLTNGDKKGIKQVLEMYLEYFIR